MATERAIVSSMAISYWMAQDDVGAGGRLGLLLLAQGRVCVQDDGAEQAPPVALLDGHGCPLYEHAH